MARHDQHLFEEFRTPDYSEWSDVARSEIQGKDPQQELAWKVVDLQGYAYYDERHVTGSISLPALSVLPWQNLPLVTATSKAANKTALDHLNRGADGILFSVPEHQEVSLTDILKNIEWPYCTLSFLLHAPRENFIVDLKKIIKERGYNPENLPGSLFIKTYPHHPQSVHKVFHNLNELKNFNTLGIYSALTSPVQQIASALAQAVTIMDQLASAGTEPKECIPCVAFAVEMGCDFFIEIAKLKALRLLWFQVARAYGVSVYMPYDLTIHAVSPVWINEAYQPHGNMIKSTTTSMAAVIGGCNALTVLPEKEDDARMARVARNVSSLLKEESRFDKVADPLTGSYYLESLTDQVIRKAWALFQQKMKT